MAIEHVILQYIGGARECPGHKKPLGTKDRESAYFTIACDPSICVDFDHGTVKGGHTLTAGPAVFAFL